MDDKQILSVDGSHPIRHFEQYMGLWAIHGPFMDSALAHVQAMNLAQHIQEAQLRTANGSPAQFYSIDDGVAVIELRGAMLKYGSSLSEAPSTIELIRATRSATRNKEVKSGVIIMDSPGGIVPGTSDWAQAVAEMAKIKPVYVYIEDMAASAAYWVASQATKIFANSSAQVGNIGVIFTMQDISEQEERAGRKTIVVKRGEYKAIGIPGAPITEKQIAEVQSLIDNIGDLFIDAVQKGRKFTAEQVAAVADGRIHIGANAIAVGLIDQIAELSDVMELAYGNPAKKQKGVRLMEDTLEATTTVTVESTSASYAEIKAACVGADPAFLCSQLDKKATVAEAMAGWMVELAGRVDTARAETAQAQTPKLGQEPLRSTKGAKEDSAGEGSSEAFTARVAELRASGMQRRGAIAAAQKEMPEAHLDYLRSTNPVWVHKLIDQRVGVA